MEKQSAPNAPQSHPKNLLLLLDV